MTIEATLASIDITLKALLTIAQTGAAVPADLGAPEKDTKPAPKKKAAAAASPAQVVDGDPEGTVYWIIEKHNTVYAQKPGEVPPAIEGAVPASPVDYLAKKAEFAKKISAAAEQQKPAAAAPSVTPTQDSVSPNSNTDVDFKTVIDQLTILSNDKRPGKGRPAIVGLLAKYLGDLPVNERKVPKLEALKRNAEIVADVQALLTDAPVAEVADDSLFV